LAKTPEITLSPGELLRGFEVKRATPIEELHLVAVELEHPGRGGRKCRPEGPALLMIVESLRMSTGIVRAILAAGLLGLSIPACINAP